MDFEFISNTILFSGTTAQEVASMADCLDFTVRKYEKDEMIFQSGDIVHKIGMVLSGSIVVEYNDFWGNKSILGISSKGDIFAEAYACMPNQPILVDVIANEKCEILFIDVPKLFNPCSLICGKHSKLIQNLVTISSKKNLNLSRRIFHTSAKTIRGKLETFFSDQILMQNSQNLTVPMDRQQLADYLNVERTALCKELGKMKKDGLIDYHKNNFTIKYLDMD